MIKEKKTRTSQCSAEVLFKTMCCCACLGSQSWRRKLVQGDLCLPADFSSGSFAFLAAKIWPEVVPLMSVVNI